MGLSIHLFFFFFAGRAVGGFVSRRAAYTIVNYFTVLNIYRDVHTHYLVVTATDGQGGRGAWKCFSYNYIFFPVANPRPSGNMTTYRCLLCFQISFQQHFGEIKNEVFFKERGLLV